MIKSSSKRTASPPARIYIEKTSGPTSYQSSPRLEPGTDFTPTSIFQSTSSENHFKYPLIRNEPVEVTIISRQNSDGSRTDTPHTYHSTSSSLGLSRVVTPERRAEHRNQDEQPSSCFNANCIIGMGALTGCFAGIGAAIFFTGCPTFSFFGLPAMGSGAIVGGSMPGAGYLSMYAVRSVINNSAERRRAGLHE